MEPRGWPFLVASGRRRDYRTLLAPDFLVAGADYGVLDEVARPTSEDATTTATRTRAGRRLTVVYATHLLTAADVGAERPPRDEHNRPLRLIYGFVVPGVWTAAERTDADLSTALGTAMEVYRGFLDDEDSVAVTPAAAFPLRSRLSGTEAVTVPTGPALAVVAVVALVLAAGVAALIGLSSRGRPPVVPCPTTTRTGTPRTSTSPSAPTSPAASPTCVAASRGAAPGQHATVDVPAYRPGAPANIVYLPTGSDP